MKLEAEWPPLSWEELRTLHYLWKCQKDLICEGLTWSIYGKYRLAVGRTTLESLTRRGLISPLGKYDNPAHDDYTLSPFGQHWAAESERDFLAQLEQRINQGVDRAVLPSPDVAAHSEMTEPEIMGRPTRRNAMGKSRNQI